MDGGMRWRRWGVVGGAWLVAALGTPSEPVEACGFAIAEVSQPIALRDLDRAEKNIEEGRFARAGDDLSEFASAIAPPDETVSARALRWRGVRLRSRAMVRRWGDRGREVSAAARAERLAPVVKQLSELLKEAGGDDPQIAIELGLALVSSGRRAEGTKLLEGLAARDLITSAHGWAALAREREQPRGRAAALARCKLMALHPERDCAPEDQGDASDGTQEAPTIAEPKATQGSAGDRSS